jgi:hypothetical protein
MTLRGHLWLVLSVTFSPDGKLIASGGYKTIKIWNAATGAELTTLSGHGRAVFCVAFSPDSKRIVSGGVDRTVRVWDVATGAELMTMRGYTDWVRSIAFSPDGQTVAVSNGHDIELLESAALADEYELRRSAKSARDIVYRLYEKHGFYHDVISELLADKELAEPLRRNALQIANSRRGEDVQKLERESWEVVSSSGKEPNSYGEALGKAETPLIRHFLQWRWIDLVAPRRHDQLSDDCVICGRIRPCRTTTGSTYIGKILHGKQKSSSPAKKASYLLCGHASKRKRLTRLYNN